MLTGSSYRHAFESILCEVVTLAKLAAWASNWRPPTDLRQVKLNKVLRIAAQLPYQYPMKYLAYERQTASSSELSLR
jgi:hypothetical protein